MTATYVIEGAEVTGLDAFWRVLGAAVNGPGGYFGANLDALADCLRGGFGTPDDGDFAFVWRDHLLSRAALGHAETAATLERRLARAHSSAHAELEARLAAARAGRGPTDFDDLVAVFERESPGALRLA
ncbi:barstar family protein [Streptomyces fuscigenes]|uniref:barstar family protein n=1 Tax=Streptomyces fuscigenes TaxID=1528880 RepID=UPI001F312FF5|nr:barstar family protein [Streptomyces fuscigenes]MCF3964389.1 barstar family protein [Streptomyces fuscigenes]